MLVFKRLFRLISANHLLNFKLFIASIVKLYAFQSIELKLLTRVILGFTLRNNLKTSLTHMSTRLIISAIAPNRPSMANDLAHLIQDFGATILEGHMTVMSKEFAVIMEVTGPWNALAKLEHQLPLKAHQLDMLTMIKRSESVEESEPTTAYRVIVSTVEDRGIINQLTHFFADNTINIEELNCRTYLAPHSEDLMGEVKLTVTLSENQSIDEIRTKFEQFCQETKLNAEITPLKNS